MNCQLMLVINTIIILTLMYRFYRSFVYLFRHIVYVSTVRGNERGIININANQGWSAAAKVCKGMFCDSNGNCRKRVGGFGRCSLRREVAAYTDLDIYGRGGLHRPLLISWILGRQCIVFVLISSGLAFVLKAAVWQVRCPSGLLNCDASKGLA